MKKIEVTVEISYRKNMTFEITDEEYDSFMYIESNLVHKAFCELYQDIADECGGGSEKYVRNTDYAVADEFGNTITDWE